MIRRVKRHFEEIIKIKTKPREIALGFAIGTLIEFFVPIPILDIIVALVVASIFERLSKISLFGALLFWNFLITWPLITLSIKIGNLIFGSENIVRYNIEIFNYAYNFTRRLLVGNIIIGSCLAFISYFAVWFITKKYQEK